MWRLTTGKMSIVNGNVISQIETANGMKLKKVPLAQSYTNPWVVREAGYPRVTCTRK